MDVRPHTTQTTALDPARLKDSSRRVRRHAAPRAAAAPAPAAPAGWGEAARDVRAVLAHTPRATEDVLLRLRLLQRALRRLPPGRRCRMAYFNRVYHTVTVRVDTLLRRGAFADGAFMRRLTVEFANLYLQALRQWFDDDRATPDAWQVLFRRGQDTRLSRLGAAAVGVNAHINFDLTFALLATWQAMVLEPTEGHHRDFDMINDVFREEMRLLRRGFTEDWQDVVDLLAGDLDEHTQLWAVRQTREQAWQRACDLWGRRDDQEVLDAARVTLDRVAAVLGEVIVDVDLSAGRVWTLLTRVVTAARLAALRIVWLLTRVWATARHAAPAVLSPLRRWRAAAAGPADGMPAAAPGCADGPGTSAR
ncbi:MAG TPA: DUF5995 family protein [Pilimelia sp.]|nr:DUF5995 family protein [Pilimelia sp.]